MCFPKLSYKLIIQLLVFAIVIGCVEVSAQPEESEKVIITVGKFGPDGCEFLGKVKGSSKESEIEEDTTSYTNRLIRARSNLINEAKKLGGNNVHVIHSNNSGKYEIPGADKEIMHIGNVYRCH
ncbi:DUF4156 domain-containing protein [Nitrosomonas supralitoralis]|uniref:DUF4156 domain-containing protein n=1 Tax=Nitrosomonas supralitoralis TaxID=2116706 RepID=A0A2P7NXK2_9PROT|nr:DUF4156 domain-containing protein [Nitrosomonas supralitoralis]PSJ18196.1 DUF4156 domain-containing protein [Nitrosomonas supralitoralis]